jgi:2-oxoglutarate ferredoxin oxidoreductase subunit delta
MPNVIKGWIEVDEVFCKGCELCVTACPMNILELDNETFTAKGYHPVRMKGEECTGCAICAVVCPEAAITVYREKQQKEIDKAEEIKDVVEPDDQKKDVPTE